MHPEVGGSVTLSRIQLAAAPSTTDLISQSELHEAAGQGSIPLDEQTESPDAVIYLSQTQHNYFSTVGLSAAHNHSSVKMSERLSSMKVLIPFPN